MSDIEKLKSLRLSLIELAIRGRLVEQRSEEGTAHELFENIQQEKAKLIKEGKLKKEKALPEVDEDEIPFEIPESWKWVRIGSIFSLSAGKNIKAEEILDCESKIHKYKCYGGNGVRGYVSSFNREGDYPIIGRQGALCGNIKKATGQFYATEHAICVDTFCNVSIDWVCKALEFLNLNQYSTATAQPGISAEKIAFVYFPLSPLAEQKRIVDKLEEKLAVIDKAIALLERKDELDKQIKKKILQMAIQGKLVEQRSEEGTAHELFENIQQEKAKLIKEGKLKKEKALPEVDEDEIPFEIPESWKWVRFGQVTINRDSERIPLSTVERQKLEKRYDYYGASGVIDKVDKYLFDKKLLLIGEDGANLLSRSSPIAFLAEGQYWVNNHAHVIDCLEEYFYINYLEKYINTISLRPYVTGTAQPKMNQDKMSKIMIALPPLAEQRRIVSEIERLFSIIEKGSVLNLK